MALIPGTKIDGYEVLGPLGAGGMGEVYRARDATLKRDVAIKVLPAYWSRDPERLHRFEREAQATAALNHPNIVSIFHVGQCEGSPYIVTELPQGGTLRDRLHHGPMRLREVVDYGVELSRGLAAAHDAGITHRDLKPDNIFLTKDGRIKILDFGLAKLDPTKSAGADGPTASYQPQTNPGHVLGTVGYMSPEQVRGNVADTRSDIFAVGLILYEMLTGKPAFRKATSAETMTAILNEDPPPLSQLAPTAPPGLQRIVNRCLAKSPDKRFQHASDLAFALEALSDSSSGGMPAAKEQPSAKRWIWTVGAVAAIAIVAAIFVWWKIPPAVPMVESVTQLTDDGQPKEFGSLVSDGSRIYFNEGMPGSKRIMQVSVVGGETSAVSTRLVDPKVEGIASDGSSLLVFDGAGEVNPMWLVSLPSGEPRRLGTTEGQGGALFPDGRITFAQGPNLFLAERDGSNVRKLLTAPGDLYCPRVSPDGRKLVLLTYLSQEQRNILAEAAADGSAYHEIWRSIGGPAQVRCAYWSADGNYLVSRIGGDVWLLPAKTGAFEKHHKPIQLTNGPLFYSSACPSRDGIRLFAIGTKRRGELVRYDISSKQFTPFLSGISAENVRFSRDGQWLTYVSHPDLTLWRSRADGTDRLQLTYPPARVYWSSISPDGKRVAFETSQEIDVISIDGTLQRKITGDDSGYPNWSPDGNSLAFYTDVKGKQGFEKGSVQLETLDLQSGKRAIVPSSLGTKGGAAWLSADTLIAETEDFKKLVSLDITTGKITELVAIPDTILDFARSLDSKYVYFTTGGTKAKVMRIRTADRKLEDLGSLKELRRLASGGSISVAPDGSPVFTRDIGSQEIYALNVRWP